MKRAIAAPAYGSHRGMMNKALIPYMTASPLALCSYRPVCCSVRPPVKDL